MTARVLASAAVLALLGFVYAFTASARMPDFEVYWRAGSRAASAQPLYREEDGHSSLVLVTLKFVVMAYARFMALSIITICYLVVVAALMSLRVRGVA